MYDANWHPRQEELNARVGHLLAQTIKELGRISREMDVEALSLADMYQKAFEGIVKRERKAAGGDSSCG